MTDLRRELPWLGRTLPPTRVTACCSIWQAIAAVLRLRGGCTQIAFGSRTSFGLVLLFVDSYGHDGLDRPRLVLILILLLLCPPPPACPLFSLGPAPSQYTPVRYTRMR